MNFNNLLPQIPLERFTLEQKRSCILTWVAYNLKIRLKEYNLPDSPSGYSSKLWTVGRGVDRSTKSFMENRISENIKLNITGADSIEELKEIMDEISLGIVDQALIVCEDMFRGALQAKTRTVRMKYAKALDNPEYLKIAFIIGVSNYAKTLIAMNVDIQHVTLRLRLEATEIYKNALNRIWKEYAESEKTVDDYLDAQHETENIFDSYEKTTLVNNTEIEKLAEEKLIYELMGEDNLKRLIDITVDRIRESVTGKLKLFIS
ncbi:hypothetical protein [Fusobacterium necrophorum]|uniref:hypothetical protein n=1 Tax=Fusobacterium necrophorum TaxID=859 RepID=UPI000786F5BC|nr:hypothetical protein [Fusobacterium necrophorum]KYM45694.1 hypothetical protein A2U15_04635 [Fusobacterium necrophorum subsp. funduliforme]MDK4476140.1 hypothetical protein [Fusobacterium necrophorum]